MKKILLLILMIFALLYASADSAKDLTKKSNENLKANSKGKPVEIYTNHLSGETSPYLLLHVHNPVDWYPWTDEAFKKAKDEDKPIFLSIGYSTCHWCHVMERESFTNREIADILNKYFVSIKVDREQHPDIDSYYQTAVQALTGAGGWPLSVFITPDKKVFYGGTYFPPVDKWGRPGLKTVLLALADKWKNDRNEIMQSADSVAMALIRYVDSGSENKGNESVNPNILKTTFNSLKNKFDASFGGFGTAPKFPMPQNLLFLLRYWKRTEDPYALSMINSTLNGMQSGGLFDRLGGGFHRYSTDRKWLIPHFEKMLYDQALLLRVYTEGYLATGNTEYSETAKSIIRYISRKLTSPEGGFFTAQDADSLPPNSAGKGKNKEEGAFYLFTEKEIQSLLAGEEVKVFIYRYGIKESGNIQGQGTEEFSGRNILYRAHTVRETSDYTGIPEPRVKRLLADASARLYTYREQRPQPVVDNKILTSWNGLMISSLAYASRSLNDKSYLTMAERAADFILSELRDHSGRLLHSYTGSYTKSYSGSTAGKASIPGMLDDYAFFVYGLLDLYMADFKVKYLEAAKDLMDIALRYFWDSRNGGFFMTASGSSSLSVRQKSVYDSALPSGNSIAALDLIITGRLFADSRYEDRLEKLLSAFAAEINSHYATGVLLAYDFVLGPSKEIVITGKRNSEVSESMINALYDSYIPNRVIVFRYTEGSNAEKTVKLSPYTKGQLPIRGKTTAYVCKNYSCELPVTNTADLKKLLNQK